jgi:hypothetical protein
MSGCFYCLAEYPFARIAEWIDDGKTALCPHCGIDAVLGFSSVAADQDLLHQMHEQWLGTPRRLTPEEWKDALEKDAWAPAPVGPAKPK